MTNEKKYNYISLDKVVKEFIKKEGNKNYKSWYDLFTETEDAEFEVIEPKQLPEPNNTKVD